MANPGAAPKLGPFTILMRWYCEMCDEWFRKSGDCPKCGYELRRRF